MALLAVLGAAVGSLLGLMGGGGSLVALPLLEQVAGFPGSRAIPAALLAVGAAALASSLVHARAGAVDLRAAVPFLVLGSIASVGGAALSPRLPDRVRLLLFAALTAVAGLRMLRASPAAAAPSPSWARVVAAAIGSGFLTGLLGVGGGFILVPALAIAAGLSMRRAVGTSLLVLGVTALAGWAGHGGGVQRDSGIFAGAAMLAAPIGAWVSPRIPQAGLRRAFGILLILVSAASAVQAATSPRPS